MNQSHWVVYAQDGKLVLALPYDMKDPQSKWSIGSSHSVPNITRIDVKEKMKTFAENGFVEFATEQIPGRLQPLRLAFQTYKEDSPDERNVACLFDSSGCQAGTISEITQ